MEEQACAPNAARAAGLSKHARTGLGATTATRASVIEGQGPSHIVDEILTALYDTKCFFLVIDKFRARKFVRVNGRQGTELKLA